MRNLFRWPAASLIGLMLTGFCHLAPGQGVTVGQTINVGAQPQRVAITPNGAEVYVTNYGDNTVSVISTATNKVSSTISVGGSPLSLAVSPDGSRAYVGDNSGAVSIINTLTKALDDDFAARLAKRETKAVTDWGRMLALASYFERHPEWREMREYGKLALVQDPAKGGLLSGGILDMIAVKQTPVRPIPRQRLTPGSLKDASMAVNLDADALTPEEQAVLRDFTRSGGTLLTGPPGWRDQGPSGDKITLDQRELERLNEIWREVNSMVGRRNLGVRLFNASSMLSNFLISNDGQTAVLHLVNYSDYPVENVSMHFLGDYKRATLLTPEGVEKPLELYKTDDGWGADLDRVSVCATVRLEQ